MRECIRCGKMGGEGFQIGDIWLCVECAEGLVCERCGRLVSVEELDTGSGFLSEEGKVYCSRCMELIMPLYEALEDSRAAAPQVEPASSISDAPVVEPTTEDLPAPVVVPATEEKHIITLLKKPPYLFIIIGAGIIITALVAVLFSGTNKNGGSPPLKPPPDTLRKQKLLSELRKKIEAILEGCRGPLDCAVARMDLRQLRSEIIAGKYPMEGLADINKALRKISLMEEETAKREYEKLLTQLKELEKKEEWDEAADTIDLFPLYLRGAGRYWSLLERRRERYLRYAEAKKTYLRFKRDVDNLLSSSPNLTDLKSLAESMEEEVGSLSETPYQQKLKDLIRRLREKAKALKDLSTEQFRKALLEKLLKTAPLAVFNAGKLGEATLVLRNVTACEYPYFYRIGGVDLAFIRFLKIGVSKLEMEFETVEAVFGAVRLQFYLLGEPQDKALLDVSLNGDSRRFTISPKSKTERWTELVFDGQFRKGVNRLVLSFVGGVLRPWLYEVGVHLKYDVETAKLQRELIEQRKTIIAATNRRVYEALKKRWEVGASEWAKTLGVRPLPPLRIGQKVDLLDVRYWAVRPDTGKKRLEKGVFVIESPQESECFALPIFENGAAWNSYDLVVEFRAKERLTVVIHTRYNPFIKDFEPGFFFSFSGEMVSRFWRAGKWLRLEARVRGRGIDYKVSVDGREIRHGNVMAGRRWRGWFGFRLPAGGKVEIRKLEFILREEVK